MLNNIKKPEELKKFLLNIYSKETAHKNYKKKWNKDNPTYGQCVPTVLLVQEIFGGEIYKLEEDFHYYNLIDGKIIDLTKEQFNYDLDYSKGIKKIRPFRNESVERFELLKNRLITYMKNNFQVSI